MSPIVVASVGAPHLRSTRATSIGLLAMIESLSNGAAIERGRS